MSEADPHPLLWSLEGACTGCAGQVVLAYYRGQTVSAVEIANPNSGTLVLTLLPDWDRYLFEEREEELAFWGAVMVAIWGAAQAVYPNLYPLTGEDEVQMYELLAEAKGFTEEHPDYEARDGVFDEEIDPWIDLARQQAAQFVADHQFEIGAVTALLLTYMPPEEELTRQRVAGEPLIALLQRLNLHPVRDPKPKWGDEADARAALAEFLAEEREEEQGMSVIELLRRPPGPPESDVTPEEDDDA
jgi:hypothetical protein